MDGLPLLFPPTPIEKQQEQQQQQQQAEGSERSSEVATGADLFSITVIEMSSLRFSIFFIVRFSLNTKVPKTLGEPYAFAYFVAFGQQSGGALALPKSISEFTQTPSPGHFFKNEAPIALLLEKQLLITSYL
ncbi:hypothetical protein FUAX_47300 (plasmid) [Fulvitalea axinellae]|uniref:Uncharacterized protein n=1 Tax=Fulvitalea axinellae TaxID=1182444 RepID=A0AAU9CPY6_9BACT|nr:hypothetical protein FUAX_47300 [Fulvitalea axinellae]